MKIVKILCFFAVTMFSSSVDAQELSMFETILGTKYYEDNTVISKKRVASLMKKNRETEELWKKSKQKTIISWVSTGAYLGFFFTLINSTDTQNNTVPLVGTISTAGLAVWMGYSSRNLKKKAILKYNENTTDKSSFRFGPTYNGLGWVCNF